MINLTFISPFHFNASVNPQHLVPITSSSPVFQDPNAREEVNSNQSVQSNRSVNSVSRSRSFTSEIVHLKPAVCLCSITNTLKCDVLLREVRVEFEELCYSDAENPEAKVLIERLDEVLSVDETYSWCFSFLSAGNGLVSIGSIFWTWSK